MQQNPMTCGRTFILVAALATAIMPLAGLAQTRAAARNATANAALPAKFAPTVGEHLYYEVSWADFIVGGELTLDTRERTTVNGVDVFHVSAQAQSVGLVSAVAMKVNDIYDSFLNAVTLAPIRAEKNTRHGKKQERASMVLDQQKRTARLDDGRTIEIPPDTYDVAGLLFAIRGIDLTIGRAREFTILDDGKLYRISVEPEAKQKMTTRAGTFDTVRVGTRMIGGGRDSNLYNLKMSISTDARRLPVEITAEPPWGNVRVRLTGIGGRPLK